MICFFFFKQKTAYEMRISDWSSDVCSSDLLQHAPDDVIMLGRPEMPFLEAPAVDDVADQIERLAIDMVEEVDQQIGVASARAEMDVADPNRAIAAPLADEALRHMRVGGAGIGQARRDRRGGRQGVGWGKKGTV